MAPFSKTEWSVLQQRTKWFACRILSCVHQHTMCSGTFLCWLPCHSLKLLNSLLQEAMENLIKRVRFMQESFIKNQAADCCKLGGCNKEMLLCAHFSPVICPGFLCLTLSERALLPAGRWGQHFQLQQRENYSLSRRADTLFNTTRTGFGQRKSITGIWRIILLDWKSPQIESWTLLGLQDFSKCKAAALFTDFIAGTNRSC